MSDDEAKQALRDRWKALPKEPAPTSSPSAPKPSSPSAPKPSTPSTTTKKTETKKTQEQTSTLVTPLTIAAVVALVCGLSLAALQTVVWVTPAFELGCGAVVGLGLIPLRRHPAANIDMRLPAAFGFVAAAFFVYLFVSCLIHGVSPITFIGATTIGVRGALTHSTTGFVIGLVLFVVSFSLAVGAARRTLEIAHDETLDRF